MNASIKYKLDHVHTTWQQSWIFGKVVKCFIVALWSHAWVRVTRLSKVPRIEFNDYFKHKKIFFPLFHIIFKKLSQFYQKQNFPLGDLVLPRHSNSKIEPPWQLRVDFNTIVENVQNTTIFPTYVINISLQLKYLLNWKSVPLKVTLNVIIVKQDLLHRKLFYVVAFAREIYIDRALI